MKEIKFRFWDNSLKRFDYITFDNVLTYKQTLTKHLIEGNKPEQFTGLKDKNGKEIYEGDVIQFDFGVDSNQGVINAPVVFSNGMYCYDQDNSKQVKVGSRWNQQHNFIESRWWRGHDSNSYPLSYGFYGYGDLREYANRSSIIEVIGNIHQDKELLNGKD
jgi:uncharacterized phage protein (TIGR01671 family)